MDLLNRSDIQSLVASEADGIHVSLMLPTHRFGSGIQADQVQWKNLVHGAESVLLQEMRRPDVEALLAPARELLNNNLPWQYMSDGLAMFLTPAGSQMVRIPASLPTLAAVGEHFVTGPLMRLLSGDAHFLLLAISQGSVRLMDGSRHTVRQIELDDVPTSLADVVEPSGRSDSMARSLTAGRGGRAVFYGHGVGADEAKKDDVIRFFREVETGLREVLAGQTAPLVLVGLEQNVSAYRELNTYSEVLDEAVLRSPDELSADELHQVAWPLVEGRLRADRTRLISRFHDLKGTGGQVSSDVDAVSDAAEQGRVETLFIRSDPWCWERVEDGGDPPVVRLGSDDRFAVCEQVEDAARHTLAFGGMVHATSQEVVPDSELAAILRY